MSVGIDTKSQRPDAHQRDNVIPPSPGRDLTQGGDQIIICLGPRCRTRAILQRTIGADASADTRLSYADVTLDPETHEVWRAGTPIELTATEFNLLRYFLLNPRRVLSKPQILDHVWHYDFDGDSNILETYISYLRKKLNQLGPPLIHTMRLVGYVFRETDTDG